MYKTPIAMAIGLTVTLSAAHADTIIHQSPVTVAPDTSVIVIQAPAAHSILAVPAFHRIADLCETLPLDCDAGAMTTEAGRHGVPEHSLDAEKRLARMMEDHQALVATLQDHFDMLPAPAPRGQFFPHLFGWHAPLTLPRGTQPPHPLPYRFGHAPPLRPDSARPQTHDLSGFYHRLNTPTVIPYGMLTRPAFQWRSF